MNRKTVILFIALAGFVVKPLMAQEQKPLKVSGYLQADLEMGQKDSKFKVAHNKEMKDFRMAYGMRRGRLKLAYKKNFYKGVFQLDITEKKIGVRNAYIELFSKSGVLGRSAFRCGVFDTPFGYEVEYSSSKRESPERAIIMGKLFPNEVEIGAMIKLQASKNSILKDLELKLAFVGGEGVKSDVRKQQPETDNRMNFISHLTYQKQLSKTFKFAGRLSTYFAKDYQLYGIDTQLELKTAIGKSKLNAEFIKGLSAKNVQGGYAMLVQGIKNLPLSAVVKYDWFDPNVEAEKDLSSSLGFGLLYDINKQLRLQAYYSKNIEEVEKANDLFHLRLQLKF